MCGKLLLLLVLSVITNIITEQGESRGVGKRKGNKTSVSKWWVTVDTTLPLAGAIEAASHSFHRRMHPDRAHQRRESSREK